MEGKQETAGEPVIIDVQCATVCKQTVNNSKQGLEEDCLMMLAQGMCALVAQPWHTQQPPSHTAAALMQVLMMIGISRTVV